MSRRKIPPDTPGVIKAALRISQGFLGSYSTPKKIVAVKENGKKGGYYKHKRNLGKEEQMTRIEQRKILVTMPKIFLDALDYLANKQHRCRAELMREVIRDYLFRHPELSPMATFKAPEAPTIEKK